MKRKKTKSHFFVGISLQTDGGTVKVRQALRGTPASGAGLRSGDSIKTINGKRVASVEEIAARLRRSNNIEIRRGRRSMLTRVRAVNIADAAEVAELLIGKGDRVPGLGHIYLARHCNSKCECVDGGTGCEIWYTFEGEGHNGGVLLKQHCSSLALDLDTLKNKWVERKCQGGPDEYI